jgi:hypothetical protein
MTWDGLESRTRDLRRKVAERLHRLFDEDPKVLPDLLDAYGRFRKEAGEPGESTRRFFQEALESEPNRRLVENRPLVWGDGTRLAHEAANTWSQVLDAVLSDSRSPYVQAVRRRGEASLAKRNRDAGVGEAVIGPARISALLFDGTATGLGPPREAVDSEDGGREGHRTATRLDERLLERLRSVFEKHLRISTALEKRDAFWKPAAERRFRPVRRPWWLRLFLFLLFKSAPEPPWHELDLEETPPRSLWRQIQGFFETCWEQAELLESSSRVMGETLEEQEHEATRLESRANTACRPIDLSALDAAKAATEEARRLARDVSTSTLGTLTKRQNEIRREFEDRRPRIKALLAGGPESI